MAENKTNKIQHAGLLPFGVERWAAERNLPFGHGYRAAFEKLFSVPGWFYRRGVKTLSVLLFPESFWSLSGDETAYLLQLSKRYFSEKLGRFNDLNCRLFFTGQLNDPRIPGDLPELLLEAERKTKGNSYGNLNIGFNYSPWGELGDVIRRISEKGVEPSQVHEGMIRKYMHNGELGDPDIMIRTGGQKRLDGFLSLRAAGSECFFLEKDWPDFEEGDVERIFALGNRQ